MRARTHTHTCMYTQSYCIMLLKAYHVHSSRYMHVYSTCSDDEVLGSVVLQHEPHALNIVPGMSPVTLGVEVAEFHLYVCMYVYMHICCMYVNYKDVCVCVCVGTCLQSGLAWKLRTCTYMHV